ncbi:hypothetical protein EDB84DRAFT_1528803 [Lactarius hengduanensis]|nr:hypothetical protein EDB84DRAFT_1528803 [Lactarius hengduanensis]
MVYELLSVVCRAVWVCNCAHVVCPGTAFLEIGSMSSWYSLLESILFTSDCGWDYASYNWEATDSMRRGVGPSVRRC